jgi:hypothetical protein
MKASLLLLLERVNLARLQAMNPIFDSFSLPDETMLQKAIFDVQCDLQVSLPSMPPTFALQN